VYLSDEIVRGHKAVQDVATCPCRCTRRCGAIITAISDGVVQDLEAHFASTKDCQGDVIRCRTAVVPAAGLLNIASPKTLVQRRQDSPDRMELHRDASALVDEENDCLVHQTADTNQ
jgi:hypothetical protein